MNWTPIEDCGCRRCLNHKEQDLPVLERSTIRYMILCPLCGNKRCPHATDHSYDCTNSNEPGQKGSVYE